MKSSRLAVDTNVLLDIAAGMNDVLDAADVIADRLPDAEQLVTPSVLDELAYLADFGHTQTVRQSAKRAVQLLRGKGRCTD
jgi:rRNA-processing protein FCF1